MRTRSLILAVLAAVALAGCGRAAITTVPTDEAFVTLDADGDGRLTQAESRLTATAFADLDANHDGLLNQLEWQGARQIDGETASQIQERNEAQRPVRPTGPGTF